MTLVWRRCVSPTARASLDQRIEDQRDGVGHQTPRPSLQPGLARLLGDQVQTDRLVAVPEKDRLTPGAPRGDVMRTSGNGYAGEGGRWQRRWNKGG
jgi:hypothetical protein